MDWLYLLAILFFRAERRTRVEFGQLHVDLELRTVTRDGQAIHLTPTACWACCSPTPGACSRIGNC